MKKTLLLFAAMFFSVALWAQSSVRSSLSDRPNKSFNFINAMHSEVVAEENGNLLVTLKDSRHNLFGSGAAEVMVRWVDKNLNVISEAKLEDTKDFDLLVSSVTADHVALLICDMSKKSCVVKRVVLDKRSLKVLTDETLYSEEFSRKDGAYVRTAKSSSGDFFALQIALETKERMDCDLLLLDDELQQIWKRTSPIALSDCLWVSDEADVYMVCGNSTEKEIKFAKITEDDDYTYSVAADKYVFSAKILNVVDNCVILGGMYVEHFGRKDNKEALSGVYGMSFDIEKGTLVGQQFHAATDNEKKVMFNKKLTAKSIEYLPGSTSVISAAKTDFGGAMLLSNRYSVTVYNSNGTTSTTYFGVGMMAFAVNKDGQIVWCLPFRHYEKSSAGRYFEAVMFAKGNDVFFTKTEHTKSPVSYDILKPVKFCSPVIKSANIAMYSISLDGKVTKSVISPKQKSTICGATTNWLDGHLYLMQAGKKDSRLVTFSCD